MITRLAIQNWRSHLNTEVDFTDGTNCFIGNMGTGKSSIMSGICFALFGTFPDLQSKKIKLEDTIMKKPVKKEMAYVELDFNINDDKWTVKRTVEKGRTTAELFKNGTLIESPQPSKVTAEIERVLKINYDLFTRAIYSEQNQLDMFLTIPKGQRMKKIDELLSIDKFEQARATTKILMNKCTSVSSEKEQIVRNLEFDDSLKRLDHLKVEMRRFVEETENMKKQLDRTKIRKQDSERQIITLKEQQIRVNTIQEKIKTNLALVELTDNDIEKLKEELMEHAEDTTEQLKGELDTIITKTAEMDYSLGKERENLSILMQNNAQSEVKINLLQREKVPIFAKLAEEKKDVLKKIKSYEFNDIEASLKKNKESLEEQKANLQQNMAKIQELEESLEDLDKVTSHCPICESTLTPSKKTSLKNSKKKQLDKTKGNIKSLKIDIRKSETVVDKLEDSIKDLNNFRQRMRFIENSDVDLAKATDELEKLEISSKNYLKQKKMQEKAVEILDKAVTKSRVEQDRIKQLIFKRNEVEIKIDKLKLLKDTLMRLNEEKLSTMSFSPSLLDRAESEYRTLITLEKEFETKIAGAGYITNEKEKMIVELEVKNNMLNSLKSEMGKIEDIRGQLKLFESALILTQEDLRKNFISSANIAMQTIWADIYPYNDFSGVRLGIENGDYVLQLQDSTGWVPVDGIASGGERSIACLVLRIAFSLILAPQLRWMVLDEPTHNLDARAVEELSNVLRDKLTNIVEQIFLITHDPSLETAVSGYLYKLDREKKKDGYTKITKISN